MQRVKPTTAHPVHEVRTFSLVRTKRHAYVKDPAEANLPNEATVMKALNPESNSKATPCTNKVASTFPEENGDGTADNTSYARSEDEYSSDRF